MTGARSIQIHRKDMKDYNRVMHIVAVHNLPDNRESLAAGLAEVLRITSYEALSRLRVSGKGPFVIAAYAENKPARQVSHKLREVGFETVLLSEEEMASGGEPSEIRTFRLEDSTLKVQSRKEESLGVDYRHINLMIRGMGITSGTGTETMRERKFSLGRAVLTSGLMMTKTTKTTQQNITETRQGFLHVYAQGHAPLVFREGALGYNSLGPKMQPSRAANFDLLIAELRRLCPGAVYDDRLMSKAGQAQLLGPSLNSPEYLDIAISLLSKVLRP
jgi:hypothetical protein